MISGTRFGGSISDLQSSFQSISYLSEKYHEEKIQSRYDYATLTGGLAVYGGSSFLPKVSGIIKSFSIKDKGGAISSILKESAVVTPITHKTIEKSADVLRLPKISLARSSSTLLARGATHDNVREIQIQMLQDIGKITKPNKKINIKIGSQTVSLGGKHETVNELRSKLATSNEGGISHALKTEAVKHYNEAEQILPKKNLAPYQVENLRRDIAEGYSHVGDEADYKKVGSLLRTLNIASKEGLTLKETLSYSQDIKDFGRRTQGQMQKFLLNEATKVENLLTNIPEAKESMKIHRIGNQYWLVKKEYESVTFGMSTPKAFKEGLATESFQQRLAPVLKKASIEGVNIEIKDLFKATTNAQLRMLVQAHEVGADLNIIQSQLKNLIKGEKSFGKVNPDLIHLGNLFENVKNIKPKGMREMGSTTLMDVVVASGLTRNPLEMAVVTQLPKLASKFSPVLKKGFNVWRMDKALENVVKGVGKR